MNMSAYYIDKIKLPTKYDRRIKLNEEKQNEIKYLYLKHAYSLRALAEMFNVSHEAIRLIVNEEAKQKQKEYKQKHNIFRSKEAKEKHIKAMQNTREYKKMLISQGLI